MRTVQSALMATAVLGLWSWASTEVCPAATWQTRNFSVTAEREETARKVGEQAEQYRRQLAVFWLGAPLPNWSKPCKLRVREGAMGAGGQTTFQFVRRGKQSEVINWDMYVQGSMERILDSVLPHEINHTIFACHFRRPLPRWADEGAATLFEDRSEQLKQLALLNDVIDNDRERITLKNLLSMTEYPEGMRPMLILYAQGYALADFLVQQKGRKAYLTFLADGESIGWDQAIRKNFDHEGVESLERNWQGWVLAGMPRLVTPRDRMLAGDLDGFDSGSNTQPLPAWNEPAVPKRRSLVSGRNTAIIRSQSPDAPAASRAGLQQVATSPAAPSQSARSGAAPLHVVEPVSSATIALTPGPHGEEMRSAKLDGPRRASIEAPVPGVVLPGERPSQHRVSVAMPEDSSARILAAHHRSEFDEYLDELFAGSRSVAAPGSSTRTASELNRRFSRREQFEPTTAPLSSESRVDLMESSTSHFESVHLPRERNAASGSTPSWAGFPGQKKLF
ncbi:MAG: hypothetical protein KDA91_09595 [Planctomycetaceae bacterium]|nr:hypothetical protein [Planctomycetaceae bacterium]